MFKSHCLMTRWPFNWKTPIGYLVAWFCDSFGLFALGLAFMPYFTYLTGSCWFFIFIADEIKTDMIAFNTEVVIVENAINPKKTSSEHRIELMNQFCATVQIYTDAKE